MSTHSTRRSKVQTAMDILIICMFGVIGLMAAFWQSFAAMKPFDDEGLLVTALRRAVGGEVWYDGVPLIYGPAYFAYEAAAHRIMGMAPSNDSVRLISISFWIATALLIFVLVRKMTSSTLSASAAFLAVFLLLQFLGEEPGHPQEACIFLAVLMAFIAATRAAVSLRVIAMAGAAGIAALCKANMGAILILAVGWSVTLCLRPSQFTRVLRHVWLLVVVAFPVVLMLPNAQMTWAQYFMLLEVGSVISLSVVLSGSDFDIALEVKHLLLLLTTFLLTVAVGVGLTVWRGSSVTAMFEWMVLKPRIIMGPVWYLPPEGSLFRAFVAVMGVVLAVAFRTGKLRGRFLAGMKLAVGAGLLVLAFAHRPGAIMTLGTPFLWVCAIPDPGKPMARRFDRAFLCIAAVLLVLYAYPVAGAQTRFVDVLLIVAAVVNLADACGVLSGQTWSGLRGISSRWNPQWQAAVSFTGVAGTIAFAVYLAIAARQNYAELRSLDLPGAHRLRLSPQRVKSLQELVAAARQSCSVLVTVPGMSSYNLWTGVPAFDGLRSGPSYEVLRTGTWMTGKDDETQSRAIAALEQIPRTCIVYNKDMLNFWARGRDVTDRPVIRFLKGEFHAIRESDGSQLMVRNSP